MDEAGGIGVQERLGRIGANSWVSLSRLELLVGEKHRLPSSQEQGCPFPYVHPTGSNRSLPTIRRFIRDVS